MKCKVVTPNKLVFDGEVKYVVIPAFKGGMGILPGHAPIVTTLGKGLLQIETSSGNKTFNIEGGLAEVRNNIVSVLTNKIDEE